MPLVACLATSFDCLLEINHANQHQKTFTVGKDADLCHGELKNSNAMSSKEAHSGAQQGMAKKSTATRYADSMSRYIELKDSKALN